MLYGLFSSEIIFLCLKRKQKLEKRVGDPQKIFGNFENLKYDSTENSGDILVDNSCDPDLYFFSN